MEQITYNDYGNVKYPKDVEIGLDQAWQTIQWYLKELSVIQIRALMADVNLYFSNEFCVYILKKQISMKKEAISGTN